MSIYGKDRNHKKVYLVYKLMHYEKREACKTKKTTSCKSKNPRIIPTAPNNTWSIDFVSDRIEYGRTLRV